MELSPVTFFDLRYDQSNRTPVLFLKDTKSERYLPVWIGEAEALSIEFAFRRESPPRPLTHDLMKNVLEECGINLVSVVIDRLVGSTYYASLLLEYDGRTVEVDCRPSDGIALALRFGTEILVANELMYHIKFVEMQPEGMEPSEEEQEDVQDLSPADFRKLLSRLKPIDFEKG